MLQDGRTALHVALVNGIVDNELDIARLLVNYGANVNIKDEVSKQQSVSSVSEREEWKCRTEISR